MKKIFISKWFAAAFGMTAFLVTIILFWNPAQEVLEPETDAEEATNGVSSATSTGQHAPSDELISKVVAPPSLMPLVSQVGEPGSLKFDNPEIVQLRIELQQEKALLMEKERQLTELAVRLAAEKAQIGAITQEVWQAITKLEQDLSKDRTVLEASETNQLRQLANVFTNMPPQNAVAILDSMSVDEVARILHLMADKEKALILENFATNKTTSASGKATEISEKMRTLAPRPQLRSRK